MWHACMHRRQAQQCSKSNKKNMVKGYTCSRSIRVHVYAKKHKDGGSDLAISPVQLEIYPRGQTTAAADTRKK